MPLLAGAAAALHLADRFDPAFPLLAAVAASIALTAAAALTLLDDLAAAAAVVTLGCGLAGASLGASAAVGVYSPRLLDWFEGAARDEPIGLEGVLREDAVPSAAGISLNLEVIAIAGAAADGGRLGGVRLAVGGRPDPDAVREWRAGRTVRVPALLRLPAVYRNPGLADDRRALARRGIVLVGSIKSAALVEVVRLGAPVSELAGGVRAWARARIAAHIKALSAKSAAVATAVVIGDRSGLSPGDERRLQDAGTYHVIAISGGNIAILALLGLGLCRVLLVPPRLAAVVVAVTLAFYGTVAAGAASVARAVAVAIIVLGGRALDHRGATLNALAVAAIASVAHAPPVVLDAGFILSFGATLGILLGVPRLVPAGRAAGGAGPRPIRQGLVAIMSLSAATACAELALAPVSAALFSRVTFAGFVLNLAAIPLMTLVQVAGLAILATTAWVREAADASAIVAHVAAAGLLQSARLVEWAPWLSAPVRPPVWWLIAGYYGAAAGLLVPRARRYAAGLLATIAIVMLRGPQVTARDAVPWPSRPVRVVVLDVGQGDSTLLQLPGGRALLVDAGGAASFAAADAQDAEPAFDIGERVVTPALRALGVSRLHALVVTHGDPDHLSGAKGVLRQIAAASVWEGVDVPPHAALKSLAAVADDLGMSRRTVQAGDVERFGSVELRVLHPPPPDWERQRVRNEDSVVLEVRIGRVSVVLPGDIGGEGESRILPYLEPDRVVILKAPHHGSATSSTQALIDRLRPAAVIFSCGRNNRFGHPHPAVVARYRRAGASIFSTAEDGAVFVETDGEQVEVRGWREKSRW